MNKRIIGSCILGLAVALAMASCSTYSNTANNGQKAYFTENTLIGGLSFPSVVMCDVGDSLSNCRKATK